MIAPDSNSSSGAVATLAERRKPIGVFDSGVGGLTVVRALRAQLPGEDIVYLGDTARLPYGTKSKRTIEAYSLACMRFLLGQNIKQLVVACNTATALALEVLEQASPVPVTGAVGPGAETAAQASINGHIGVLGTLGTVNSNAYPAALAHMRPGVVVSQMACPLLVPLAEEGWTDDEVARVVAARYLAALQTQDSDIDVIVLGCTHYPLLQQTIATAARQLFGREVAVVDSAGAMARKVAAVIGPVANRRREQGALRCFATDGSRLDELAPRFLGQAGVRFDIIDLAVAK